MSGRAVNIEMRQSKMALDGRAISPIIRESGPEPDEMSMLYSPKSLPLSRRHGLPVARTTRYKFHSNLGK